MDGEADSQPRREVTPEEWARRWTKEFTAAKKAVTAWHQQCEKVLKVFKDERGFREMAEARVNLYSADHQTQAAMLYGQRPRTSVSRRHGDPLDDAARVGGEMLQRLLNTDAERDSDEYHQALAYAEDDWQHCGLGVLRLRYDKRTELRDVEPVADAEGRVLADGYQEEAVVWEDVESHWVYWRDFLWSPCRVWSEARWAAFLIPMTKEQREERFPDAGDVPLNSKKSGERGTALDAREQDPWARTDVWEIWSKEHGKVFWYVEGHQRTLDVQDDPYQLEGFWPMARPLLSNTTTSSMVPTPDYALAQDHYTAINTLSTRIKLLVKALRIKGTYDKANPGLRRLLDDSEEAGLIPVDNWAMFAEKGGIKGAVDFFPLADVAATLDKLREARREEIELLREVTGWSDIMRGQAAQANVTATEQRLKASYGSVRIRKKQEEFARFASDTQRIRGQLICKLFQDATIRERSNIDRTPDARYAEPAIALLRSDLARYRIEVKPEAVAAQDFGELEAQRGEAIAGLATFLQAAAPLVQQLPGSAVYLLQMLQWRFAGLRGASGMEGILDQAIAQAQRAPQGGPAPAAPDPKLLVQQMKGQADLAKVRAELEADLVRTQAETQAASRKEQDQAMWNIREAQAKQQMRPPPTFGGLRGRGNGVGR